MNIKFFKQENGKILIDVRRAALAGAREIEVSYELVMNSIQVDVRKTKIKEPKG